MHNVKVESLEESPSLGTGPAAVLPIVVDDCIENDGDTTVLDQVLVFVRADILADQGAFIASIYQVGLVFLIHCSNFIEPHIRHLNCEIESSAVVLLILCNISLGASKKANVL